MKVSIVGSCVTRDILQVVDGLSIGPYLARTSLASIASPPQKQITVEEVRFDDDLSPWHRKLITADFEKTHDEMLREMAGGFVVIDLIEERVKLLLPRRHHYVTRAEILAQKSNVDRLVRRRLTLFSRRGLRTWLKALPTFAEMLGRHVPSQHVIVNRVLYTPTIENADRANGYLSVMYDAAAAAFPGSTVVTPSKDVFRTEPEHKWGRAPFHFVDEFYFEMARKIMAVCGIDLPLKPGFTFRLANPAQSHDQPPPAPPPRALGHRAVGPPHGTR